MYIRGLRFLFRDIPTSDRRSKEITYANNKYEYELRLRAHEKGRYMYMTTPIRAKGRLAQLAKHRILPLPRRG
jgi:hypothetical protein